MGNFTLDQINEMYIDVLREIGNIGAGNATTAIATMLNSKINMNVPKVELMDASKLGSAICPEDEIIVGIFLEVSQDITGSMMFLMKLDSAHYLTALSNMTNLTIAPSIPYVSVDMAGAILSVPAIMFGQYGDNALLIETEFGDDTMINGYFILMPEQDSYATILSSLGIQM